MIRALAFAWLVLVSVAVVIMLGWWLISMDESGLRNLVFAITLTLGVFVFAIVTTHALFIVFEKQTPPAPPGESPCPSNQESR